MQDFVSISDVNVATLQTSVVLKDDQMFQCFESMRCLHSHKYGNELPPLASRRNEVSLIAPERSKQHKSAHTVISTESTLPIKKLDLCHSNSLMLRARLKELEF